MWGSFNIQLVGDRDWGWNLGGLGTVGVPKERAVIVVWSLGGKLPGGLNVYGWTTAKLSRPSPNCTVVKAQPKEPSLAGLGPVTRVKDGWAFGRKFGCLETGRVLITLTRGGREGAGRRPPPEVRPGDGSGRARERRRLDPRVEDLRGEGEVVRLTPPTGRRWPDADGHLERALPPGLGEDRDHLGVELRSRAPLQLGNRRACGSAGRYGRSDVMASKASATASTRASGGMSAPARAGRVAAAVPVLVVVEDARRGCAQRPDQLEHSRPFLRVCAHVVELVVR